MKNKVLNYDKISSLSFVSQDYTSKNMKKILSMPELSDSDWIEYIELYDDQTVEQISFILYDSADFWDLLASINNIDPLFDMAYEFDILEQISEAKVQKYLENYSGVYKSDTYNRLKERMISKEQARNEYNRQFKIIKPERLYDFMNILKDINL